MRAAPHLPSSVASDACRLISCVVEAYRNFDGGESSRHTSVMREILRELRLVINKCGVDAEEAETRTAAIHILKAIWYSDEVYRDDIIDILMESLETIRNTGHRANELLEFTKSIIMTDTESVSTHMASIDKFCCGLKDTVLQVSDHPRADIYRELRHRQLLHVDALDEYWLETDSSMRDVASYIASQEFKNHSLDTLKKSQSFTKNSAMTKLRESMTIKAISMNLTELKTYIHVKEVEVWRTTMNKDMNAMRSFDPCRWQFLGKLQFSTLDSAEYNYAHQRTQRQSNFKTHDTTKNKNVFSLCYFTSMLPNGLLFRI